MIIPTFVRAHTKERGGSIVTCVDGKWYVDNKPCFRYVLHSGYVTSKNDGEEHFVSSVMLHELYNLDIRKCVLFERSIYQTTKNDVHLYPRSDGRYFLTKEQGGDV